MLAKIRADPKSGTYGTPGEGSAPHFLGVLVGRASGAEFTHVPTLKESGIDIDVTGWFAMIGPAGIAADAQKRLKAAVAAITRHGS